MPIKRLTGSEKATSKDGKKNNNGGKALRATYFHGTGKQTGTWNMVTIVDSAMESWKEIVNQAGGGCCSKKGREGETGKYEK